MKKVIIQVATEFHYMVALSLVEKHYTGDDFEIHIVICSHPAVKGRLSTVSFDGDYIYHHLEYNHHINKVFDTVNTFIAFVKQNEIYHFVSFLYHDPLFIYLTHYFKSKNTKSFLAPDGMGAYVKFKALNLRSRYINTKVTYRFFKLHKLSFNKLWFTSWDFGANGYYDAIYAYSKTLPYVSPSKEIIAVDYSLSAKNAERLKRLFGVDFGNIPAFENVVLVINEKQKVAKYEQELLKVISETMPGNIVLFKKHPNQTTEQLDHLKAYPNVYRIDQVFPVELLIAGLKNSVIISSYSNSMLYHNDSCTYYWTYPIVTSMGELNKPVERFNPKEYIKVVQDFTELKKLLSSN